MASSVENTCCICEEEYNLEEKKPLLLPCSHSFCKSCLQQMKTKNNNLCPFCRASWAGQSVDSLLFIRQLVDTSDKNETKTKDKVVCCKSNCTTHYSDFIFWCNTCKVPICSHCFIETHKECDLIHMEKTDELMKNLRETVASTRKKLLNNITLKTRKNNLKLADITTTRTKLQQYETVILTFAEKLATKQKELMSLLEKFENIPFNSSVEEITATMSKTLSLLDDPMTEPKIPKFIELDSEGPADDTILGVPNRDGSTESSTRTAQPSVKVRSGTWVFLSINHDSIVTHWHLSISVGQSVHLCI